MSRSLYFTGLLTLLGMPFFASAATLPLLDSGFSLVPEACRTCACGMGGVLQVMQNLMNIGVSVAVIALSLFIAWAGFLFMMSATNPESRSQARGMLINAFVGMFIVLAAWLIVDFIMKRLYDGESTKFGPWNSILQINDSSSCIEPIAVGKINGLPGIITTITTGGSGGVTGTPGVSGTVSGGYGYQSGVEAQKPAVSAALSSLLSCMQGKLPSGIGQISALTDKYSTTDAAKIAHCAQVGSQGDSNCAHTVHSAHYGGYSCVGKSYAVDFGDEQNANALISAAKACGAPRAALENGNHVHVSAPNSCGQNGSASN